MNGPENEPVLPEQTADDTDVGWGERTDEDDTSRFLDDVPPHHVDRED